VNRAAVIMMVVAAALMGASIAIVGGIAYEHHLRTGPHAGWMRRMGPPGPEPGGRPPLERALPRLVRALDLTPEQIERIKPKVIESQKQFEAARESLRSRIDAELTPAQRQRWHEMERTHGMGRPFRGRPDDDEHPDRPRAGNPGEPR
jgi:hypothetical protein